MNNIIRRWLPSNEQSIGIAQVHIAIAELDSVTQQNAVLVDETTLATDSLKYEADYLLQNMAFFKISNHPLLLASH